MGAVFQLAPQAGGGWNHTVLYSFPKRRNGEPIGGVILDPAGNIYGVSAEGGPSNTGYVYQLTKDASGVWTSTILHYFGPCCDPGPDGINPAAGLVLGPGGALYGTASQGALLAGTCSVRCGTVFRLKPYAGSWEYDVVHYFQSSDGQYPRYAGVTSDRAGNMCGCTEGGGLHDVGTVWQFVYSPATQTYTEHTLHHFGSDPADGVSPLAGVVVDPAGKHLYGAAFEGGLYGNGNVFALAESPNGAWSKSILYQFTNGTDGQFPSGGVVLDAASGTLYGMTEGGGAAGDGVVYQIT